MLRGRAAEQEIIDALLGGSARGASGALIVRGEPGVGKTALLDYAAARAAGMRVLRGAGVESEAELPFAGLHLLLGPVMDGLPTLPEPQRRAISGAFGLDEPDRAGDRFMIGAAVLSLLAEAAEAGPLLCLVDDAHWLDQESAEVLLFAARRLDREGVVVLFAARDHAERFASAGVPVLLVAGLDAESAAALLDDAGDGLSAAQRQRFIAETRGNPLALLELASVAGEFRTELDPMPVTSRVLDAFHQQVRALPRPAQNALLLAAADDSGDLAMLLRAGAGLGVDIGDLQPAADRELIALTAGTLTFRHPLLRAAAYHGAQLTDRMAAHGAWATTYGERGDGDRRAWHLAATALGPDEEVARDLERAADRAVERAGHATAAATYDRAAQLSEDAEAATRRQVLACEAGIDGGQLEWAGARAHRLVPSITDPRLQARLIQVRAAAGFAQGELSVAHGLLTEGAALVAAADPERAFWMLMRAFHAVWAGPTDRELLAGTVDRFDTLDLAPDGAPAALRTLVRWCTAAILGRDTAGLQPVDDVLPRAVAAGRDLGPPAMIEVASRALVVGRDDVTAQVAAELVAGARAAGTIVSLPAGLGLFSLSQAFLGRHRDAIVNGTEAIRIARDTGQPLWVSYAAGALAHVAAVEGDEERCRRQADAAALDRNAAAGSLAGATTAQTSLALLDLGLGRVQAAFDRLQAVAGGPTPHQSAVVRCFPDHVEAAVRLGRAGDVAGPLAAYRAWAGAMRQPWIDALLARCHALTAPDDQAEQYYKDAIELHDDTVRPFDRARTRLLYGEWLRRLRRKSDARVHLDAARQEFEAIGSAPWAARARAELGAAGVVTAPVGASADLVAALTPQELQIAGLAAHGLSNRDIAAQLYLSPRTVAYHLYKAYPKLGIASRGELAASLAGAGYKATSS